MSELRLLLVLHKVVSHLVIDCLEECDILVSLFDLTLQILDKPVLLVELLLDGEVSVLKGVTLSLGVVDDSLQFIAFLFEHFLTEFEICDGVLLLVLHLLAQVNHVTALLLDDLLRIGLVCLQLSDCRRFLFNNLLVLLGISLELCDIQCLFLKQGLKILVQLFQLLHLLWVSHRQIHRHVVAGALWLDQI